MWGHRCCCHCDGEETEKLLRQLVRVNEAILRIEHEQLKVLRHIDYNTTPQIASIGIEFSTPTPKKEQ